MTPTTHHGAPSDALGDFVTVLFGYGRVPAKQVSWIDSVRFTGGVAHDVPSATVTAWRRANPKLRFHTIANDAPESDYAKACGVQLVAPERVAAVLKATDVQAFIAALGPEAAREFGDELRKILPPVAPHK